MPYSLSIDTKKDSIICCTTGELQGREFHLMVSDAIEILEDTPYRKIIVDHSLSTVKNLSVQEIHAIAMICSRLNPVFENGRVAIVMVHDLDYGLGRIWHSYALV